MTCIVPFQTAKVTGVERSPPGACVCVLKCLLRRHCMSVCKKLYVLLFLFCSYFYFFYHNLNSSLIPIANFASFYICIFRYLHSSCFLFYCWVILFGYLFFVDSACCLCCMRGGSSQLSCMTSIRMLLPDLNVIIIDNSSF